MKKLSFFSAVAALAFLFSACDKSVPDQIADEGTSVGAKTFVWVDSPEKGYKSYLYSYGPVTASQFAHFESGGTQFNNGCDFDVPNTNGSIKLCRDGNGNGPVYIKFAPAALKLLKEGDDCDYSIGVRFKGSLNAVWQFNIRNCVLFCIADDILHQGNGKGILIDGGTMGPVTQIRFAGAAGFYCEEVPDDEVYKVYFYKNECEYNKRKTFFDDVFFNGTLTLCPFFKAGQSQNDYIWHEPIGSSVSGFEWATCDGVQFYSYDHDVQAAFFGVENDEWNDKWQIVGGESGLPVGDITWPITGLTEDIHIYAIIDYKSTPNCDGTGTVVPPVDPVCDPDGYFTVCIRYFLGDEQLKDASCAGAECVDGEWIITEYPTVDYDPTTDLLDDISCSKFEYWMDKSDNSRIFGLGSRALNNVDLVPYFGDKCDPGFTCINGDCYGTATWTGKINVQGGNNGKISVEINGTEYIISVNGQQAGTTMKEIDGYFLDVTANDNNKITKIVVIAKTPNEAVTIGTVKSLTPGNQQN